jgi:hypothetical protein
METKKNIKTGHQDLKGKEGFLFKEIPMRNTSAGGWKLWYTIKGPGCNQQTCC